MQIALKRTKKRQVLTKKIFCSFGFVHENVFISALLLSIIQNDLKYVREVV